MTKIKKPIITDIPDGNVFAVIGAASNALKRAGLKTELEAFKARYTAAMTDGKTDYHGMLAIVSEYVEFDFDAGGDEDFDEDEDEG
jgi:hypothetical protein